MKFITKMKQRTEQTFIVSSFIKTLNVWVQICNQILHVEFAITLKRRK